MCEVIFWPCASGCSRIPQLLLGYKVLGVDTAVLIVGTQGAARAWFLNVSEVACRYGFVLSTCTSEIQKYM
jgi:hypothetical protein